MSKIESFYTYRVTSSVWSGNDVLAMTYVKHVTNALTKVFIRVMYIEFPSGIAIALSGIDIFLQGPAPGLRSAHRPVGPLPQPPLES